MKGWFSKVNALKCYQCTTDDRLPCDDRYLRECPNDQAYDMCSVVLKNQGNSFNFFCFSISIFLTPPSSLFQKSGDQLRVTRKCVLGPCTLRDHEVHGILQLREQCDMNRPDYNCIYCCRGDGCNRDSASSNRLHQMAVLSAILVAYISYHFRFWFSHEKMYQIWTFHFKNGFFKFFALIIITNVVCLIVFFI